MNAEVTIKTGEAGVNQTETAIGYVQSIIKGLSEGKVPENVNSIVDVVTHPSLLSATEQARVRVLMESELRAAQITPPIDIATLAKEYSKYLEEKNRVKLPEKLDFKSIYLLNRRIAELKKSRIANKDEFKEETELKESIIKRLDSAGVSVDDTVSLEDLITQHNTFILKENEAIHAAPENDYSEFRRNHPSLAINNIRMASFPEESVSQRNIDLPIRHLSSPDHKLSIVFIPDDSKEDDAVGVSVTSDGKVNIVVADGVSGSALPKVASRLSRDAALKVLETNPADTAIIKAAYDDLQAQDLTGMALAEENRIANIIPTLATDKERASYSTWLEKSKAYREKKELSASTLAAVQYDQKAETLTMAVRGDSSVIIFKKNGGYERHYHPGNKQVLYDTQPMSQYRAGDDISREIKLDDGDVVLVCSDGVDAGNLKSIFDDVQVTINNARSNDMGNRLDVVATNYLKAALKKAGISDDVSIVALQHSQAA